MFRSTTGLEACMPSTWEEKNERAHAYVEKERYDYLRNFDFQNVGRLERMIFISNKIDTEKIKKLCIFSLFFSLFLSLSLSLSLSIYKYNMHQPLGCLVDSAFSVTSAELAPIYWSWSAARSAKSLNATAKEMVSFISLHYLYALFHSVVAFPPGESAVPLRIPVTLA